MTTQRLQFVGFCFIFMGIILICVLAGGYSSFWRSQTRVETSQSLLTDACQKRLDLLPGLIEMAKKSNSPTSIPKLNQAAQKANKILQLVLSQEEPLKKGLINEFEISQAKLTLQLKELFTQLEASLEKKYSKQFVALKNQFNAAQDNLFVNRVSYNDEVRYFSTRSAAFPTSLLAKLFGFNKINYIEISKDLFLPGRKTFTATTS